MPKSEAKDKETEEKPVSADIRVEEPEEPPKVYYTNDELFARATKTEPLEIEYPLKSGKWIRFEVLLDMQAGNKRDIEAEIASEYSGREKDYRREIIHAVLRAKVTSMNGEPMTPRHWEKLPDGVWDLLAWTLVPDNAMFYTVGEEFLKNYTTGSGSSGSTSSKDESSGKTHP